MAELPFTIFIQAALQSSQSTATAGGEDDHAITATEMASFSLSTSTMQSAYNTLLGATPDDVGVADPIGDHNLYATCGWKPVTTSLVAGAPTDISVSSPPQNQSWSLTTFNNSGSKPATFHAAATVVVETTLSDTWTSSDSVSVSQEVSYGLKILGLAGQTSFSYTHEWGTSQTQSSATTLGLEAGVEVTLDPGQSAYVVITATPGTLTFTIPYTTTLSGGVAANYSDKCQGHHFWYYVISRVLGAISGAPQTIAVSQTITIGFFANVTVSVHDVTTGEVLAKYDVKEPTLRLGAD